MSRVNWECIMFLVHRAAQKKEYHRRWRSRQMVDEVFAAEEHGLGDEPAGAEAGEGPDMESQEIDRTEVLDGHVPNGEGMSEGVEAQQDNVVLPEPTESIATADGGDDVDERVTPRHRKCGWAASKGVNDLVRLWEKSGFSQEEKKIVLHRYFSDERIRAVDPEFAQAVLKLRSGASTAHTVVAESLRGALQTIRRGRIQGKTKVRNIVLTAAVSKGDSQRKICRAIGASRYLVRKAFQRRAEVDETGENLWAGGDRKRRSDALSPEDQTAVCNWWETETTVSPNKRDVKRRRIGAKEHETHATHYLQTSQVQ